MDTFIPCNYRRCCLKDTSYNCAAIYARAIYTLNSTELFFFNILCRNIRQRMAECWSSFHDCFRTDFCFFVSHLSKLFDPQMSLWVTVHVGSTGQAEGLGKRLGLRWRPKSRITLRWLRSAKALKGDLIESFLRISRDNMTWNHVAS